MLKSYSKGQLTYETDRLIAISGIVKKTQKLAPDTYLAGLWFKDFPHNLMWTIDQRWPSQRMKEYVAPTWSWASTTGRLSSCTGNWHLEELNIIEIDLLNIHVDASPMNPLGLVSGGFLHIMGSLARARFECSVYELGDERMEVHLETDNGFEMICSNFYMDVVVVEDRGNPKKSDEFFYLPIRSGFPDDLGHAIQGLLLESTGNKSGEFRRCGCFDLNLDENAEIFLKARRYFDMNAEKCGLEFKRDEKGLCKFEIMII